MPKLIGNAPNQVPTNADLGTMAFEDKMGQSCKRMYSFDSVNP